MKKTLGILSVCFLALAFQVKAEEAKTAAAPATSAASANEVLCSSKAEKRKLSLIAEGSGCRVDYTKGEETKAIGNQKNGTDFCEKLIERVKTKLVGSGFEC